MLFRDRSRASCGHSFLKYSILFYCSIALILSVISICYLTKLFGIMTDELSTTTRIDFGTANNQTSSQLVMELDGPQGVLDTIRLELIGIIVASAFMIIFFLGLIGTLLESILCLRIFGAILSYLFLLTFGAALYIIILLFISHVPLKLILSTISCAAVAITLHALLAIAPFAFADLINQVCAPNRKAFSQLKPNPGTQRRTVGGEQHLFQVSIGSILAFRQSVIERRH